MAKVRILVQPSGLLNGVPWPEAGETLTVPDVVADDLVRAGLVEVAKAAPPAKRPTKPAVEKRPAPTANVEKRKA